MSDDYGVPEPEPLPEMHAHDTFVSAASRASERGREASPVRHVLSSHRVEKEFDKFFYFFPPVFFLSLLGTVARWH